MDYNVIHTLDVGERVTSTYADIYYDDSYCPDIVQNITQETTKELTPVNEDKWISPSDLLIGKIELKPPFTSKITRGKTHEGILSIGNAVLENEYSNFLKKLNGLISDNDCSWNYILTYEKEMVKNKVESIHAKVLDKKLEVMAKEINTFYQNTLQELENHLRSEVNQILISTHANMVSGLNVEIKNKLEIERKVIEKTLQKHYNDEVKKIKTYYKLLLNNELYRKQEAINKALNERNDVFASFCKQFEAENLTSTMYVMCTERKKCKIKQFLLDNYQSSDTAETLNKLKCRLDELHKYKLQERPISQINRKWEDKIQKVLQIFLKFISFSLKLLPEQTTFLLDLEKMLILQLNEMQKVPINIFPILVNEEDMNNKLKFEKTVSSEHICAKQPFVIEGDLNDPTPPRYTSSETLPSDVDLPLVRVQRHFIFAKCHKFEEIKETLAAPTCSCNTNSSASEPFVSTNDKKSSQIVLNVKENISTPLANVQYEIKDTKSSDNITEPLLIEDIHRLKQCPNRHCKIWATQSTFPNLNDYLDYNEVNFIRVTSILGKLPKLIPEPELINAKNVAYSEFPFSVTKERFHHVETQCSSTDDILELNKCPCMENYDVKEEAVIKRESLSELLQKHKTFIRILLQQNPKLLSFFTDECFDFIL